jgi:hypothetical protein
MSGCSLGQVAEFEKRNPIFKTTLSQALFHGKAQAVVAKIERNGIPINYELYSDMEKYFSHKSKLKRLKN